VGQRLRRLGFRVDVRAYQEVDPADLADRALVIVSLFDYRTGAEQALERIDLAHQAVPVICMEPAAFPVLGLTGPKLEQDFGFQGKEAVQVTFPLPDHPLSAGLRGEQVELFPAARDNACMGWGRPRTTARTIAHLTDHPCRAVLFAYDSDAPMVGLSAPDRRIGLFLDPQRAAESSIAWALFEAAVEWSVSSVTD
jgi:hypothetical protein